MVNYDRHKPFYASIIDRLCLNHNGNDRQTWHFSLSLEDSGITYVPGDSIAIIPHNDPKHIDRIIELTALDAEAVVTDSKNVSSTLREYLFRKVNIAHVTKKFLVQAASIAGELPYLQQLLSDDIALKNYLSSHTVIEVLESLPHLSWNADNFIQLFLPLLPRFYSIASSPSAFPQEVHLTVARVIYNQDGRERRGVCSHFLCDLAPLHKQVIPVYLQPTKDFHLPIEKNKKIIMIGPGTGVAPFRAFMQEREHQGVTEGCSWLFFGERHKSNDYFYQEFWENLVAKGVLDLDTAFSRDQEEKVYVQHKMWQKREKIWQWLEAGAAVYVCGNADAMAKDVDHCLIEIVQSEGKLSPEGAKEFIKRLRSDKRYLRDVY